MARKYAVLIITVLVIGSTFYLLTRFPETAPSKGIKQAKGIYYD